MSFRKPKKISALLSESGPLADAAARERVARIQTLSAAMDAVARQVGVPGLRLHGAGFRTLILAVPDGAGATRLRYANRKLLDAIRQCTGLNYVQVAVRVVPDSVAPPLSSTTARKLGHDAGRCLCIAADRIDDPGLRSALLRLADHAKEAAS